MKLNKEKQKMYLNGEVGIINDGTVEQLREVTNDRDYMGKFAYYHKNRIFPSDAPLDNVQYHPISWFYEKETELPKRVKYMGTEYDVVCKQDPYYRLSCGVVKQDDCTPITTPTSYKLNIDIPEWVLKAGDDIEPR
jgi:hypothetical protein